MRYLLSYCFGIILLFHHIFSTAQDFSDHVLPFIKFSEPEFAITNVTLIDGTGADPKEHMTVVVKDGKISHVGPTDQIALTPNFFQLDGTGKTLIPGFVMMHEHIFYTKAFEDEFNVVNMTNTFPRMYLAGGVTTMRTAGSVSPNTDLNIHKLIEKGKMLGPKMDVTSPFIERENNFGIPQLPILPANQPAGPSVDYWAHQGCTSFKVYMDITREDLKNVVQHAHARGLKVTGHLCSIRYREAADIGIDNLEHDFMASTDFVKDPVPDQCNLFNARSSLIGLDKDDPAMDSLMKYLIKKGVTLTTTPAVFAPLKNYELILGGGEQALHPDVLAEVKDFSSTSKERDSVATAMFNKELYWVRKFYDMGGKLMVGTDPTGSGRTIAGYSNMWTLELLIKKGFTPSQAVRLCSYNGAEYLGRQFVIGSIEKAKSADMILMDGNLTLYPESIRNIQYVFKDGIGYDSKKIFESVKGKVGLY